MGTLPTDKEPVPKMEESKEPALQSPERKTTERTLDSVRTMWFSNRTNSDFRWKQDKSVVGALEVPQELQIDFRSRLREQVVAKKEDQFEECLELWQHFKMRKSFVEACAGVPAATQCCGLINDQQQHTKDIAEQLNRGWVKSMNKKIRDRGYKISCFVWTWNNPSGKATTTVLLVRFHSLNSRRLSTVAKVSTGSEIKVISKELQSSLHKQSEKLRVTKDRLVTISSHSRKSTDQLTNTSSHSKKSVSSFE